MHRPFIIVHIGSELRRRTITAMLATLVTAAGVLNAQTVPVTRAHPLLAPDGSKKLYVSTPAGSGNDFPELSIDDLRANRRTLLFPLSRTVSAEWSPDSTAFAVNDERSSDSTRAYIYDASTLTRQVDVAARIADSDPGTNRFRNAHAYFVIDRWIDADRVTARLYGHTDSPNVLCFELRYELSRAGAVKKLSERVTPLKNHGCEP